MKIISTKVHGVLDYLMGLVLFAAPWPWLLGFADGTAAQWVPITLGVMMIVMSFFTNYELGVIKVIPMGFHLGMDVLSGIFLAASPWIFGFSETVYLPHLILGIAEVGAGIMTRRTPKTATTATVSRA